MRDPLPTDLGLGVAVRPARGIELVADVNLQLGQDYVEYEDPALAPSPVDLEHAFRASLGVEAELGTAAVVRAGMLYNGSAAGELGEGGAREDYLGVTGGLTWHGERTRTGLGGFYLRSSGELVPVGDPGRTVAARSTIVGVLFTTAYQL